MNQPAAILLLALTFGSATAQKFSYPMISNHGQTVADFIPGGWSILDSAEPKSHLLNNQSETGCYESQV